MENEIPQEKVDAVVDYLVNKGLTSKGFQDVIDRTNDYYKAVADFIAQYPNLSVEELAIKFDEEQKLLEEQQNNLNNNEQPKEENKKDEDDHEIDD